MEYIDNEMIMVETPAVTNFYLSQGEKYGIGRDFDLLRLHMPLQMMKPDFTDSLLYIYLVDR